MGDLSSINASYPLTGRRARTVVKMAPMMSLGIFESSPVFIKYSKRPFSSAMTLQTRR
jgi:hypothetical protein